jgi:hypothetical protein
MAWGLPSGRRRPRDYSGPAARRIKAGPPGAVLRREQQPRSGINPVDVNGREITPAPVLGASHAAPGETVIAGVTHVNKSSGGAAATTGYGAERVGKRFTVAFTPDGRVVHLYGNDVPADQRRVVLRPGQRA